jgi:ABC-2 type transport system ATP-binding protein
VADSVIAVTDMSKRYRVYRRKHQSIKEILVRRSLGEWDDFWALQNMSFEVPRGQFMGVIGHNGSGKSTLLKVLTGILRPDRGTVQVRGRVSSLLELGAGFQPEYTGRENVYLYGALLGLRRQDVKRKYDSIVDFAELAEFMEYPVKNYSSGMYVRLGFAVAVHLDPEILLIDEVLAVGDAGFQHKCFERLYRLRAGGCTIVLVSHDTASVSRFCERAIWLDHGHLMADGASDQVIHSYADAVAAGASLGRAVEVSPNGHGAPEVAISSVRLLDAEGEETREPISGSPLRVEIGYEASRPMSGLELSLTVYRDDGVRCLDAPLRVSQLAQGDGTFVLDFPAFNLQAGGYDLSIAVYESDQRRFHDFRSRSHPFTVRAERSTGGLVWLDHHWAVRSDGRATLK